jgi:hypothetical protein
VKERMYVTAVPPIFAAVALVIVRMRSILFIMDSSIAHKLYKTKNHLARGGSVRAADGRQEGNYPSIAL